MTVGLLRLYILFVKSLLGLDISLILPSRFLYPVEFLGMLVDSIRLAFVLPADKIQKFSALREGILAEDSVDLFTLQKICWEM